jgi:hypothetical protein
MTLPEARRPLAPPAQQPRLGLLDSAGGRAGLATIPVIGDQRGWPPLDLRLVGR